MECTYPKSVSFSQSVADLHHMVMFKFGIWFMALKGWFLIILAILWHHLPPLESSQQKQGWTDFLEMYCSPEDSYFQHTMSTSFCVQSQYLVCTALWITD